MNQTLRPQPQLAEVLPGALTLAFLLALINDHDPCLLNYLSAPSTGPGLLAILAGGFLFASWIFGTLLETIRNGVVENVVDCFCKRYGKRPLNWDFFFLGDSEKVTRLDEYYFAYYQATANYAIGSLLYISVSIFWFPIGIIGRIGFYFALAAFIFFAANSISLRREIKKLVGHLPPAHLGVYTRLKKSRHGVGVFAILEIPEGRNVFDGDSGQLRDIDDSDLNDIPLEIRQLYDDFCLRKGGRLKGPSNFNNLTVGWYLNHSDTPNVRCDEHFDFIATRLIKKGEELTADYRTYDERPLNFTPCSGSDPAA
jgi:hypothetical protein